MNELIIELAKEICRARMFNFMLDSKGCPTDKPFPYVIPLEKQREMIDKSFSGTTDLDRRQIASYMADATTTLKFLKDKGLLKDGS